MYAYFFPTLFCDSVCAGGDGKVDRLGEDVLQFRVENVFERIQLAFLEAEPSVLFRVKIETFWATFRRHGSQTGDGGEF